MRFLLMLSIFATASFLHGAHERTYQGINPTWKSYEDVGSRLNLISKFLPANPVVFEAGAKDGEDSMKLARMWPEGMIISFEPIPHQFVSYQQKAQYFPNMWGHNLAVNTYNGMATFFLCWGTGGNDPVFEGASSLLEASEAMKVHYMGPQISVACVVLDDWCNQYSIPKIDFMWLDLEGFELQTLKSSPSILKTVKVVYSETNFFEFRKGTTQYPELEKFMKSQGFTPIAHWYNVGLQGDVIFVRNELLSKI
jgi:FkbM family methyltransferase